ncbi:MAG TPA: hypothetical protein DDZ62_15050, partial [Delftia acidovorans]|nr:hypothetical protein [Delftia acidovorans]
MDDEIVLLGLLLLAVVLAVPVLLVMALVSVASLKRRVAALEDALARGQVGEAGDGQGQGAGEGAMGELLRIAGVEHHHAPAIVVMALPQPARQRGRLHRGCARVVQRLAVVAGDPPALPEAAAIEAEAIDPEAGTETETEAPRAAVPLAPFEGLDLDLGLTPAAAPAEAIEMIAVPETVEAVEAVEAPETVEAVEA